jgi:predicted nucleotidyltransferase component of viral defense system
MKPRPSRSELAGSRYLALQRLARAQRRPTAELLQLYVLESFLRRLAHSTFRERLVLKGGMLLAAFDLRRATRDVDLLALQQDAAPESVQRLIADIARIDAADGTTFSTASVSSTSIREDDVYPGVRVGLDATIATACVRLSVDINVGDPVVPAPARIAYPTLLGDNPIDLVAYPREMVVAEKLVTALQRGASNTRWRDFADLLLIMDQVTDTEAVAAIAAVARHRGVTPLPLGEALAGMPQVAQQRWSIWMARNAGAKALPSDFETVLALLDQKTRALMQAARQVSAPIP